MSMVKGKTTDMANDIIDAMMKISGLWLLVMGLATITLANLVGSVPELDTADKWVMCYLAVALGLVFYEWVRTRRLERRVAELESRMEEGVTVVEVDECSRGTGRS